MSFWENEFLLSDDRKQILDIKYLGNKCLSVPEGVEDFDLFSIMENKSFSEEYSEVEEIVIPASLKSLEVGYLENWFLKRITVNSENSTYASIDGVLYDKNISTLIECPNDYGEDLIVPSSVRTIKRGAFIYSHLSSVHFKSLIDTIETDSFTQSTIGILELPYGVKYAERMAFWACDIDHLIWPNTFTKWECDSFDSAQIKQISYKTRKGIFKTIRYDDPKFYELYGWEDQWYEDAEATKYLSCSVINGKPDSINIKGEKNCIIPEGVEILAENAIINADLIESITIPKSLELMHDRFWKLSNCKEFHIHPDNKDYKVEDDVVFSYDGKTLYRCSVDKSGHYDIPEGVDKIDFKAFAGCKSIRSVHIPSTVSDIWNAVFYGCSNLYSISVDANNQIYYINDGILYSDYGEALACPATRTEDVIIPKGVNIIAAGAFYKCKYIKKVSISDDVECIQDNAFDGCTSLEEINFYSLNKNKKYTINKYAFSNCTSLKHLELPEGLEVIDPHVFNECTALETIKLPSTVQHIDKYVFYGLYSLAKISVNPKNTHYRDINGVLFSIDSNGGYTELIYCPVNVSGTVTIPDGVESFKAEDIIERNKVSEIRIGKDLECIEGLIYRGWILYNEQLETFYVDSANPEMSSDSGILYNKDKTRLIRCPMGKIGDVVIPNGVTFIENGAFLGCSKIKRIVLPETIEIIGNRAFTDCDSLVDINIPASVKDITLWTVLKNRYIACCMSGKNLHAITINHDNTSCVGPRETVDLDSEDEYEVTLTSKEGLLYSKDMKSFILCPSGRTGTVTLDNSTKTIKIKAFADCEKVTDVILPNSVTKISTLAFSGSGIKSLHIPKNVKEIAGDAFDGCKKLSYINVSEDNTYFYSKDGSLYRKDTDECLFKSPESKSSHVFTNYEELAVIGALLDGTIADIFNKYGVSFTNEGLLTGKNIQYVVSKTEDPKLKDVLIKLDSFLYKNEE